MQFLIIITQILIVPGKANNNENGSSVLLHVYGGMQEYSSGVLWLVVAKYGTVVLLVGLVLTGTVLLLVRWLLVRTYSTHLMR